MSQGPEKRPRAVGVQGQTNRGLLPAASVRAPQSGQARNPVPPPARRPGTRDLRGTAQRRLSMLPKQAPWPQALTSPASSRAAGSPLLLHGALLSETCEAWSPDSSGSRLKAGFSLPTSSHRDSSTATQQGSSFLLVRALGLSQDPTPWSLTFQTCLPSLQSVAGIPLSSQAWYPSPDVAVVSGEP